MAAIKLLSFLLASCCLATCPWVPVCESEGFQPDPKVSWQENRCRIYSFGLSGYRAVSSSPSNVECYCEAQCWSLAAPDVDCAGSSIWVPRKEEGAQKVHGWSFPAVNGGLRRGGCVLLNGDVN